MDKLKALQYFIASAEEGSFARAAQRLDISVPAVQKLVGALERAVGLVLLDRGSRGVRLTASGADYLDRCRPLLAELDGLTQAEGRLKDSSERPGGTLVVAAHPQLAHHLLVPTMPRFHAEYPDIDIDFRTVHRMGDEDAQRADVLLMHGWPEVPPDYVQRKLGGARMLVAASPEYWTRHGVPHHPSELERHCCLMMRNPAGIVLDLWEFSREQEQEQEQEKEQEKEKEKEKEKVQVPVKGWLSSNAREVVLDLVVAGHGVGRFSELTTRDQVRAGRLVPVLPDWDVQGGPPVNLLFRGNSRRTPRVRVFIDHVVQSVHDIDGAAGMGLRGSIERPAWHLRGYGRASATVLSRR